MTRSRPFPLDDAAEGSRRAVATPVESASERTWPVLARIGELRRAEAAAERRAERRTSAGGRRTYRIDAAHQGATRHAVPPEKHLAALPNVLRLAVEGWRLLDAYKPLMRAAAMLALMALAGLSMAVIMGPEESPKRAPSSTASAIAPPADGADALPAIPPPIIEPIVTPDAPTTSASPTAVGPVGVIVPEEEASGVAADDAVLDETAPEPIAAAYPVTPYAEPTLPAPQTELPTVRASDSPLGIARLQGEIREVPVR